MLIQLPEELRETGLMKFASDPPKKPAGKVVELWDHFRSGWRDRKPSPKMSPEAEATLLAELKLSTEAPLVPHTMVTRQMREAEPQSMHFARMVPVRRGSFYVLPKDIKA